MARDVELLDGYDEALQAIVRDAAACGPGDRVEVGLYIIEPGASSARVVEALRGAAARGARVRVAVDWTAGSHLSRVVERATSLVPALEALARATPGLTVVRRRAPDHSKWLRFERAADPCAVLGSLNLGDRFRGWRDQALRVSGAAHVAGLARALAGQGDDPRPAVRALEPDRVTFVANAPPARLDVRPALEALLDHPALERFQVAAAYLDRAGAALLARALERGARVELLLPAQANVYHQANLRALAGLVGRRGFSAALAPGMLHRKTLVAHDAHGPRAALLGSANLKRNSFRLFAELCALVTSGEVAAAVARSHATLAADAAPVEAAPRYARLRAWVEERLG